MSESNQQRESSADGTVRELSRDDKFDLLSNHRRRYALQYIQRNGNRATIGELSEQIAAWENGIDIEDISYDERKRVYTSLQQVHLPRMDEKSVVEYDDREGVVEVGPAAEDLDFYLEIVQEDDIPWSQFYLGLSVLNLAVAVLAAAGVPFFDVIPPLGWAVFVVTTFLVTSAFHTYYARTEMRLGDSDKPPTGR